MSQAVLDCPMGDNDANASTVRDYLVKLLAQVWTEGEGFDGKRPFGNSAWEYEIYAALITAGLVSGAFDEHGYIDYVETHDADRLVHRAIATLGVKP